MDQPSFEPLDQSLFGSNSVSEHQPTPTAPEAQDPVGLGHPSSVFYRALTRFFHQHDNAVVNSRQVQNIVEDEDYSLSPQTAIWIPPTNPSTCLALQDVTLDNVFGQECYICRRQFPRDYDEIEWAWNFPNVPSPVRITTWCCGANIFCGNTCVRRWFNGVSNCGTCLNLTSDLRFYWIRQATEFHPNFRHPMVEIDDIVPEEGDDDDDESEEEEDDYGQSDYYGQYDDYDHGDDYDQGDDYEHEQEESNNDSVVENDGNTDPEVDEDLELANALERSLDDAYEAQVELAIQESLQTFSAPATSTETSSENINNVTVSTDAAEDQSAPTDSAPPAPALSRIEAIDFCIARIASMISSFSGFPDPAVQAGLQRLRDHLPELRNARQAMLDCVTSESEASAPVIAEANSEPVSSSNETQESTVEGISVPLVVDMVLHDDDIPELDSNISNPELERSGSDVAVVEETESLGAARSSM